MSNDLISVIVPTKSKTIITQSIQSLINQSYENWEAIIISDDRQYYESYLAAEGIMDERLHFVSESLMGSRKNNARNIAYKHCKAEWVTTLEAGDTFESERLKNLFMAAQSSGVATSNVALVNVDGDVESKAFDKKTCAPHTLEDYFVTDMPLPYLFNKGLVSSKWHDMPLEENTFFNVEVLHNAKNIAGLVMEDESNYNHLKNSYSMNTSSSGLFFASYMQIISLIKQNKSVVSGSKFESKILDLFYMKQVKQSKYESAKCNGFKGDFYSYMKEIQKEIFSPVESNVFRSKGLI